MEDRNYIDQITQIRTMMDRSSRFLSLSGLSGILAGVYAVIGAFGARYIVEHRTRRFITLESVEFKRIVAIAIGVMLLSILSAMLLSRRKARKRNETVWNATSRRMLINMCIPLLAGGIFAITILRQGHYGLICPITLIFYGLALINGSKYTLETIRSLGILFVALGLINAMLPGYGLEFWTIGFGGFHILYGTIMYFKFDRATK